MGSSMFRTTSKYLRNFLSHTASLDASQATTYSASIVESAMQDCLILLHTTAPPLRMNTDPEVDFLDTRHSQVSTWICKHQVPSSSKILENMLSNNQVLGSMVGLKTANYANCKADIRSSAKHSIHEASYGKGVRNFPHVFNILCSLGRLVLREWDSMPKGCLALLGVLHREAIHHLISIRCLRERQIPVLPISNDLDPQNVRGFS